MDLKERVIVDSAGEFHKNHRATVIVDASGKFNVSSERIITPKGLEKDNKLRAVRPSNDERVVSITDEIVERMFPDLQHINLILTNACNLSCTYCYEQHTADFGRFTPDSLLEVYKFLLNCNDLDGKLFQFFGGEPLIHKDLILQFMRENREFLAENSERIHVSMITNGVLLSPEFIEEYFSFKDVNMGISLDTIHSNVDHREIGQDKIDHIVEMIGHIPQEAKDQHEVSIRCTIAQENAPYLRDFATKLYDKGLRAMVIHPLTMSSTNGRLGWPPELWDQMKGDIMWMIETLPNFTVQFSEGVGTKGGNNCMVGSDMIAVDGSGDFSGCYFFTNQKEMAAHTILGNLLQKVLYVDRYKQFQDAYNAMFESEQCQTCHLKNFCYQCPAGNLDTSGTLFRPDNMCKDIVRLFLSLQDDIVKKSFKEKLERLVEAVTQEGEQSVFAKAATYLMYREITGVHLPVGTLDGREDELPDYRLILGRFLKEADKKEQEVIAAERHGSRNPVTDVNVPEVDEHDMNRLPADAITYLKGITAETDRPVEIKDFYEQILTLHGTPSSVSKEHTEIMDVQKRTFYLALAHMFILNPRGRNLETPKKITIL